MTSKIAAALHAIMEECSYVRKGGKNEFHGYKYAGEADLLDVLRPSMVKHGLMMIPSGQSFSPIDAHGNIHVAVDYTLIHKDGEVWPEKITAFGAGNDKNKGGVGDKGLYKALTGANKYFLFKLFQIETGDDPEKAAAQKEAREEPDMDVYHKVMERIAATETRKDLESYWRSTQMMLADFNIVNKVGHPGSKPYAEIVNAVRLRLETLKKPPAEEPKQLPKPALDADIPF